jgi:hypothetical protein
MHKCKCGNAVANNARFCPKCGHRFTSGCTMALAWFFGIVIGTSILAAIIGSNQTTPKPEATPEQKAADATKEESFQRAVVGAKQLQKAMRNPDSFKLTQVLIMDDGSVCYDYRSQNGFGGINLGHAVLSKKGQFKSNEDAGFTSLWNKLCAKKTGREQTWEVGYAAGLHGLMDK